MEKAQVKQAVATEPSVEIRPTGIGFLSVAVAYGLLSVMLLTQLQHPFYYYLLGPPLVVGTLGFIFGLIQLFGYRLPPFVIRFYWLTNLFGAGVLVALWPLPTLPALFLLGTFATLLASAPGTTRTLWWSFWLPLAVFGLLMPFVLMHSQLSAWSDVRLAFLRLSPGLLLCGWMQFVFWLRQAELDGERTRFQLAVQSQETRRLLEELRSVERAWNTQVRVDSPLISSAKLHHVDKSVFLPSLSPKTLKVSDLAASIENQVKYRLTSGVRFHFTRPSMAILAQEICIDQSDFDFICSLILDLAQFSVGRTPYGCVQIEVRPGIDSLHLMIEDNGTGLGVEHVKRLAVGEGERLQNALLDVRSVCRKWQVRFDFIAKLGVGTRYVFEFPRRESKVHPFRTREAH